MLVDTLNFSWVMDELSSASELVVDTETTGLEVFTRDKICGIAIKDKDHEFYFPFRHASENLSLTYIEYLQKLFEKTPLFIGFNYKFDIHALNRDAFKFPDKIEDVLLAAHLANENEPTHALKALSDKYLDAGSSKDEHELLEKINQLPEAKGKKKKVDKGLMYRLPASLVEPYACADVRLTKSLHTKYSLYLQKWGLWDLWQELNQFILLVASIEHRGLSIDIQALEESESILQIQEKEIEKKLIELFGPNINCRSPLQLKKVLGTPDVSKATLKNKNLVKPEIADAIEAYRVVSKIKKTYLEKFKEIKDIENRIHCNFNITGTVSGRLSCSTPNLQALPRQDATDTMVTRARNVVKNTIVSRPGTTFIEADFSQLELRIAAHVADSKPMKDIFASGIDFHQATAEKMGCTRQIAKGLNFAILYGAGANKIASMLGLTIDEAQLHLKNYFKTFPELKIFNQKAQNTAAMRGYVRLFTGRIRRFHGIENECYKAMNNIIQGSGAEATRLALTAMVKPLAALKCYPVLTVHDSIMVEALDLNLKAAIEVMGQSMEYQPWCSVPLKVDVKVGKVFGGMAKYAV